MTHPMIGYIYLLYFGLGLLAGCLSGLFGIGGGLLIVPILNWALKFHGVSASDSMHIAIATSLAIMMFTSVASTWAHSLRKAVHYNTAVIIGLGIVLGSVGGSIVSYHTQSFVLKIILAIVEIIVGVYLFFSRPKQKDINEFCPDLKHKLIFIFFGLAVAFLASLLGVGGGIFFVPFLIYFGLPTHHAIGTSAACTFITAFSGTVINIVSSGHLSFSQSIGLIYIPPLVGITIGCLIAAPLGAYIAHKFSGKVLRKVFAVLIIGIGIVLWV